MARISTSIRVDKEPKEIASKIFKKYGLSLSDGINIFLHQVALTKGFPFEIKLPNSETRKALKELKKKEGEFFDTVEEMFASLDNEI